MSEMVIAIYKDDDWLFYNEKLEQISYSGGKNLYLVLPDQFFYFFQTNIISKRNIRKSVKAYAKTIFPEKESLIGYIYKPSGTLGYIVSEKVESIKKDELLKNARLITTPFLIQYAAKNSSFVYIGEAITAVIKQEKLVCYIKGGYEDVKSRTDITCEKVNTDTNETIKLLIELVKKHRHKNIELAIEEKKDNFSVKKILPAVIAAAIVVISVILGQVLRYEGDKSVLLAYDKRINNIYKKAFGGKIYQDPYGMLLYKAKQCKKQNVISPIDVIYALAKAKKGNTVIDYVAYDTRSIKIKGNAVSYDSLVSYLDNFNKILHINAKISNTRNKNGKLRFNIIYNEE